jgi:peptide/nickel transport system permease protein
LLRSVGRRLWLSVPLLFGVSILTFVLESLTPGNPAAAILGTQATPETTAALSRQLGLNQPIYDQYWHWLERVLHGDLGKSILTGEPVTSLLDSRLSVTLSLIVGTVLVSSVAGVALGVAGALRGGVLGRIVDALSLLGLALPNFWLGYLLVLWLAISFKLFPATGYVAFGHSPGDWLRSLVLPVFSLSLGGISIIAKQTRDAMLDVLQREFIRALRARGVSQRSIVFKHALRNALPNVVTLIGLFVVSLLLGTTLIESVFALPGLGSEVVLATSQHDLPVIEGVALYFTLIVVVVFILVDSLCAWLNPKVRLGR